MIIVTGLGRCGTSAMMLLLKELGFKIGRSLSYSNDFYAGMELAPGYAISRDMYTDFICQKDENGEEVYTGEVDLDRVIDDAYWGEISMRNRILRLDNDTPSVRNEEFIEVFKDPRVTWHPKIIRTWWKVRQDIKLIIMHRQFEDIIKSRDRVGKGGFLDPKRFRDLKQFKEDFADFLTEVLKLKIPYSLLFYPNVFQSPVISLRNKIHDDIEIDIGKNMTYPNQLNDIWEQVIDKNKIHSFEKEKE